MLLKPKTPLKVPHMLRKLPPNRLRKMLKIREMQHWQLRVKLPRQLKRPRRTLLSKRRARILRDTVTQISSHIQFSQTPFIMTKWRRLTQLPVPTEPIKLENLLPDQLLKVETQSQTDQEIFLKIIQSHSLQTTQDQLQ